MNLLNKNQLVISVVVAFVNLLVGCTPKDGSRESHPGSISTGNLPRLISPQMPPGQASANPAEGTSDSGGGNGINGKVFESYIRDITQLPAFKEYVQKWLENIKTEDSNLGNLDKITLVSILLKKKVWYFAPVDLSQIDNQTLGISFIKDTSQQIGRQTEKEVWTDSRLYDAMDSTRNQADHLLHEIVEGLYLFKFVPLSEFYKSQMLFAPEQITKDKQPPSNLSMEQIDSMFPPEAKKKLDAQDYSNIKYVTNWIIENSGRPISDEEFRRIALAHDFDKRLFKIFKKKSNAEKTSPPKSEQITKEKLFEAIKSAGLTGNNLNLCSGVNTGIIKDCKVELNPETHSNPRSFASTLNIKISIPDVDELSFIVPVADVMALTSNEDPESDSGEIIYVMTNAELKVPYQIGDRIMSVLFFFRALKDSSEKYNSQGELISKSENILDPNGPTLILESLVVRAGVLTGIDMKRQPSPCTVLPYKSDDLISDAILLTHKGGAKYHVIEKGLSAVLPIPGYCGSDFAK